MNAAETRLARSSFNRSKGFWLASRTRVLCLRESRDARSMNLRPALNVLSATLTAGFALMSCDSVRQFGISLFASAGVAGIVAGLAARPLFENLIAGLQLAFTQPLRLGDAVVINNEFGTVEEIGNVYVVINRLRRRPDSLD